MEETRALSSRTKGSMPCKRKRGTKRQKERKDIYVSASGNRSIAAMTVSRIDDSHVPERVLTVFVFSFHAVWHLIEISPRVAEVNFKIRSSNSSLDEIERTEEIFECFRPRERDYTKEISRRDYIFPRMFFIKYRYLSQRRYFRRLQRGKHFWYAVVNIFLLRGNGQFFLSIFIGGKRIFDGNRSRFRVEDSRKRFYARGNNTAWLARLCNN